MNLTFGSSHYDDSHGVVKWSGVCLKDGPELTQFLQQSVGERYLDRSGRQEFRQYLQGLSLTGMGQSALAEVLNADSPEERAWAAGEALAEALLIEGRGVVFPWNMERDKRNSKGSLPGADLVGFIPEGSEFRLALGEVKTSSEVRSPPQVVNGRHGLGHQIDDLATDLAKINQLLYWLLPRVKSTAHDATFRVAVTAYFNSGNKNVALFGLLIRDTQPAESDLEHRGKNLGTSLNSPTSCHLIGVYLPWPVAELPGRVSSGGAA